METNNTVDEIVERYRKYKGSEYRYIWFYPAEVDYWQQYFQTEVSRDKRTKIGHYILIPHTLVPEGEIIAVKEDSIKIKGDKLMEWQKTFAKNILQGKKILVP